jgi:flagellar biogenesis protein FliO
VIQDVLSMIFAFLGVALVIGLTYYASKWYARRMGPLSSGKHIKVVERLQVSRTGAVIIIEVNGEQYMVGASDQSVQLMTKLEEPIPIPQTPKASDGGFAELVKSVVDKVEKVKSNERQ